MCVSNIQALDVPYNLAKHKHKFKIEFIYCHFISSHQFNRLSIKCVSWGYTDLKEIVNKVKSTQLVSKSQKLQRQYKFQEPPELLWTVLNDIQQVYNKYREKEWARD